jgi:hypothetical protein
MSAERGELLRVNSFRTKITSLTVSIGIIICIAAVVFAFSISTLPALAASGEEAGDSLIVGVPTDRCPVFYLNADTKEITGIGTDLMRLAAENAGYSVSFKAVEELPVRYK